MFPRSGFGQGVVLDGTVIGRNMQRHRHQELICFLNAVEREVSVGKTVHAILDNFAAHKHPAVRQWIARHLRWTFHFTPTSASWLNAVEGFFATLTKRRLKRGVFRSVADLQAAINRFLDDHNANSKPFEWIAEPDKTIATVRRGHQMLDSIYLAPSRLRWVGAVTPTRVAASGGYTANEPGRPARGGRPVPTPPCG